MSGLPHGHAPVVSGNLLADKRYAYAVALATEGDHAAAADLFAQAVEQAPTWAAAHLAQGLALERCGDRAGAAAAFEAAVTHDPAGLLGAALHLARLQGAAPPGMPAAYVETLFDQYAPRFDAHLVGGLGYRGPAVIAEALAGRLPDDGCTAALDLGCGTGLMARALGVRGLEIDGIDLSAAMLAQAATTGLYRNLWQGDCTAIAATLDAGAYRLAIAADVLVYIGDLLPLFTGVARVLQPGGLLAATVQADTGKAYSLGTDLRFRHEAGYLRGSLDATGFGLLSLEACVTRQENCIDVPGLVFVARRA
ncbi:methyltransferase domain-containing protein [Lichenihabitans sp. Uapishka_5]|uniref:class I SAM-dependent DNA methyltransferase n=1 Tax=Lichenihabitans sp. Uapishka_5 TaxID=3037302 RepID=UPI0029E7E54B|nr:methyltransferase domain-containing protein [Lichenihabitans sp. Uapishka_5]MDX7951508.1 methyltransferase domain-containing protein [Lichenihabitans sp. Uapishka_5]